MGGRHSVPFCDRSKPSREALARFGMSGLDRIEPEHRSPDGLSRCGQDNQIRSWLLNTLLYGHYYMTGGHLSVGKTDGDNNRNCD